MIFVINALIALCCYSVISNLQIPLDQGEYVRYYHDDRTHIGLGKQTPGARLIEQKANGSSELCADPRLGGLHHRYTWAQAA